MTALPHEQRHQPEDLAWAQKLPKIELHAHLNGSIRRSTLQELAAAVGIDAGEARIQHGDERSLSEMFAVFSTVHRSVRGPSILRRVAREVLEDFDQDGIAYLELRTTPRPHEEHKMSKEDYVNAVLAGFEDYRQQTNSSGTSCCHARLLLSIDRSDPPELALETVQLALKLRHRGIVGIDLSGNPTKGSWRDWTPALQTAREHGLKITLHAGEVQDDEEMKAMLDFKPDRFGHCCFLSKANQELLQRLKIPLELCLSSNVLSRSVPSYKQHHFMSYYNLSPESKLPIHPIALSTDDVLIFDTCLSLEVAIAMSAFSLSKAAIVNLEYSALHSTFLEDDDPVKGEVLERLQSYQDLV